MKKNQRIFIGSSSDYAPKKQNGGIDRERSFDDLIKDNEFKLRKVLKALESAGHTPVPWWKEEVWMDAESFWNSLIRASKYYDGGIFIFGKDDRINNIGADNNNNSDQVNFYVTRDNVLIEFGMFIATKGKNRTLAIYDINNGQQGGNESLNRLMPPSDLTGITYPSLTDEDLEDRIIEFFKRPAEETRFDEITFYIGSKINNKIFKREYTTWKTKGLYIGTESAVLWDKIESHPEYEQYIGFVNHFSKIIDREVVNSIDNIVSLGPGNGKTDLALVTQLRIINDTICYVPIDINPMLVFKAIDTISSDGLIRVPFAIVDDFEEHHQHIKEIINGKAHEIGKRNLFVMLGVTFSNLEGDESRFFIKMQDWMGPGDYFLLDAIIKEEELVGTEQEAKARARAEAKKLQRTLSVDSANRPNYKNLLINAIVKKHLVHGNENTDTASFNKEFIDQLVTEFDQHVQVVPVPKERTEKYSIINNTSVMVCQFKRGGNPEVLIGKEYEYNKLKEELERHFVIKHKINGITEYDKVVHRGLFLLQRKPSKKNKEKSNNTET